ncbi:MAG: hypothetical protein KME13_15100 [Myxacorys californica WJT36-NPBG1]|jgi:hypothetical protein|nr:hypothetical protein [Myxacorys californica WJT36-NPBG1]
MASHSKFAFRVTLAFGLSGLLWGIDTTIVSPRAAQASVARVDLALVRLPSESFESLARRAELAARAAVQRSFDKDILTSNTSVIVTGQASGLEAPILSINVSREQWRTQPDSRRWATYYKSAKLLLDFGTLNLGTVGGTVGGGMSSPAASPPLPLSVPNVAPPKSTARKSAPSLPVVTPAQSPEILRSQTPLPPPQLPK